MIKISITGSLSFSRDGSPAENVAFDQFAHPSRTFICCRRPHHVTCTTAASQKFGIMDVDPSLLPASQISSLHIVQDHLRMIKNIDLAVSLIRWTSIGWVDCSAFNAPPTSKHPGCG